ncbi:hypothetical protein GJU39_12570 [Pedobacter petrophilus]|uniref:Uncharacterized protein n=1 Tax=Pedobacter petrophilus TaxID=1908241 RepID=A0A7K0FZP5_9SPHI|nr:hypothetical protein [Pedobacter petrophilus]MRX76921.1 hypothetical protein [Pedobacter petrophilus]
MGELDKSTPIDKVIAQEMVSAYGVDAKSINDQAYTKAVWFPADQILEIAQKINDGKHDGLRIYFAKYITASEDEIPVSHRGRNTVLLVPTFGANQTNRLGALTELHEDDTEDIQNRGTLCPTMCDGVEL